MNIIVLKQDLQYLIEYPNSCEDCEKIKRTVRLCSVEDGNRSVPLVVWQDLILHCAEHAFRHEDKSSAERCLEYFFSKTPENLAHLGRAFLLQAKLVTPTKFDIVDLKNAMKYIADALTLNEDRSVSKEDASFLSQLSATTFWNISRKFMIPGIHQHLLSFQKNLYAHVLRDTNLDANWKITWGLTLLQSGVDAENNEAITETWTKLSTYLDQLESSILHNVVRTLYQLDLESKCHLNPKLRNGVLEILMDIWRFKKSVKHGFSKDEFDELVEIAFPNKVNILISAEDRFAILKELFYVSMDIGNLEIAKMCIKAINKLELNAGKYDIDMLKILAKEKTGGLQKKTKDPLLKKQHQMVAIAKAYRTLQKHIPSAPPEIIQAECIFLWNLCLKFLSRETRQEIHPSLELIEKGLEFVQSNCISVICQLAMELAKCDLVRGDYENAEKHWNKANLVDEDHDYEDLLELRLLHCKITKEKLNYKPLKCEEDIIYNLYEVLSVKPKDSATCRSILFLACDQLSDELFSDALCAEQWPWEYTNQEKWLNCYGSVDAQIEIQFQHLAAHDDKKRFLLWARVARFASEYQLWDICRVAVKFCKATKIATLTKPSSLTQISKADHQTNDDIRIMALVNLNLFQALAMKLKSRGLTILDAVDDSIHVLQEDNSLPNPMLQTIYSEIISKTSQTAITNMESAINIGMVLNESWLVILAANQLWNEIFDIQHHKKFYEIIFVLQTIQHELLSYGSAGNLLLLINYTNCVTQFSSKGILHATSVQKPNQSTTTIAAKSIVETCETVLHLVCTHMKTLNQTLLWKPLYLLIKLWLKLSHSISVPLTLDKTIFCLLENDEQKKFQLVISTEFLKMHQFQLVNPVGKLEKLEEVIALANETEWEDTDIIFKIWCSLASRAYNMNEIHLFKCCYEKVLQLKNKISNHTSNHQENCKLVCNLMCMHANTLLLAASTNPDSLIEGLDLLIISAKKCANIKQEEMLTTVMKIIWNTFYSVISNLPVREALRKKLTDILSVAVGYMQSTIPERRRNKSENDMVFEELFELTCFLLNGLVQVLIDNKDYDLARQHLIKTISVLAQFKHQSTVFEQLKFHLKTLNMQTSYMPFSEECSCEQWKDVLCPCNQISLQIHGLCNTVFKMQTNTNNILERTFNLLTLSECLLLSECSNSSVVESLLILAYKYAIDSTADETAGQIQIHLATLCTVCQLEKRFERGSANRKSLIAEAVDLVLKIWQLITENSDEENLDKWADCSIHLQVPKTLFHSSDVSYSESIIKSLYVCLINLAEELEWYGYYHLMLPVLTLTKVLLFTTNFTYKMFFLNLKLLKTCIGLDLAEQASELHSVILQSVRSVGSIIGQVEKLNNMREIKEMEFRICERINSKQNSEIVTSCEDSETDTLSALDEIKELLSLGYVELAVLLLRQIFSRLEVNENKGMFVKATLILVELEIIFGNYEEADSNLRKCQDQIDNDVDGLQLLILNLDTIIKLKNENWNEEVHAVLKQGIDLVEDRLIEIPTQTDFYNRILLKLNIKQAELQILHCKNFDTECDKAFQDLLTGGSECFDKRWIRQSLAIYRTLLSAIVGNPVMQQHDYDYPICVQIILTVSSALTNISEIVNNDGLTNKALIPEKAILPVNQELLELKILHAQLKMLVAKPQINDTLKIHSNFDAATPRIMVEYIASLPPWDWEEYSIDPLIVLDETITISYHIIEKLQQKPREAFKCLYLLGNALSTAAKYIAAVYHCTFPETTKPFLNDNQSSESHSSPDLSVLSLYSETASLSNADALNYLYLNVTTQAVQYYVKVVEATKTTHPDIAADAALGIVDCTLSYDSAIAFQYLLWHQTFKVTILINQLLLTIVSKSQPPLLETILKQQIFLVQKGLTRSPLFDSLDHILKKEFQFSKYMSLTDKNIELKHQLPANINVIIILQHSTDRDQLYCGLFNKGEVNVAKTKCKILDFERLISKSSEIQDYWYLLQRKCKNLEKVCQSDEFSILIQKFKSLQSDVEAYISPLINILSKLDPRQTLQSTNILLLSDIWLQQLPLEALPIFRKHFSPCLITRDFSYSIFNFRSEMSESGPKTIKERKQTSKMKLVTTTVPVDVSKLSYIIEDEFNVEYKTFLLGQEIKNMFETLQLEIESRNVIVREREYLMRENWGQNEIWQNMSGLLSVTSPQVCEQLIQSQVICDRLSDVRPCIILQYSAKISETKKQENKFTLAEVALTLTLAGFANIVTNQWIYHKSCSAENAVLILKEITGNVKGINTAVNTLNGIYQPTPDNQSHTIAEQFLDTSKERHAASTTKYDFDPEQKFLSKYLRNVLVSYGLPTTVLV